MSQIACPHCGTQVYATDTQCMECGANLKEPSAAQAAPQKAAPPPKAPLPKAAAAATSTSTAPQSPAPAAPTHAGPAKMVGRVFGLHGWADEKCTRRSGDQMQILVTPWAIYFSDVMSNAPWHVQLTGVLSGVVGVLVGLGLAAVMHRGPITAILMGGGCFIVGWTLTSTYARKATSTDVATLKGAKSVQLAKVLTDLTIRKQDKAYHLSLPHAFGGENAVCLKEPAFRELKNLVRKALNDRSFEFQIK